MAEAPFVAQVGMNAVARASRAMRHGCASLLRPAGRWAPLGRRGLPILRTAAWCLLLSHSLSTNAAATSDACAELPPELRIRAEGVKGISPSANAVLGQELRGEDTTLSEGASPDQQPKQADLAAKLATCRLQRSGALEATEWKIGSLQQEAAVYTVAVEHGVQKFMSQIIRGAQTPRECSLDYRPPTLGRGQDPDGPRRCRMSADISNAISVVDSAYTTARARQLAKQANTELSNHVAVLIREAVSTSGWKPSATARLPEDRVQEFLKGPGQEIGARLLALTERGSPADTTKQHLYKRAEQQLRKQAEDFISGKLQEALFGGSRARADKNAVENARSFLDNTAKFIQESMSRAAASERFIGDARTAAEKMTKALQGTKWDESGSRIVLSVVRDITELRIADERTLTAALSRTALSKSEKEEVRGALRGLKAQVAISRASSSLDDVAAYANFANAVGLKINMKNLQRNVDGAQKALSVAASLAAGNYFGALTGAMGMFGAGGALPGGGGPDPAIMQQLGEIVRLQQLTLQKLDELSAQLDRATEQIMNKLDYMGDVLTYVAALEHYAQVGSLVEACQTFVDAGLKESVARDGVFLTYAARDQFFRGQQGPSSAHNFGKCHDFLVDHFNVTRVELIQPYLWDFRPAYKRGAKASPGESPFGYDKRVFFPMVTLSVHLLDIDRRRIVSGRAKDENEVPLPAPNVLGSKDYDPLKTWYGPGWDPTKDSAKQTSPATPAIRIPDNCGRAVVAALASAPASLREVPAAKGDANNQLPCADKNDPEGANLIVGREKAMGPNRDGLPVGFPLFTAIPIHTDYVTRLATASLFIEPYVGLLDPGTGPGKLSENTAYLVAENRWKADSVGNPGIENFHKQLLQGVDVINLAIAQQVLVSGALIAIPAARILLDNLFGEMSSQPPSGLNIRPEILNQQLAARFCASDMFQFKSNPYQVLLCMLKQRGEMSAFARNVGLALVGEASQRTDGYGRPVTRFSDRGEYEALLQTDETVARSTRLLDRKLARYLTRRTKDEPLGVWLRAKPGAKSPNEDFFLRLPEVDDVWQWRLAREAGTDQLLELRQRTLERVIAAGYVKSVVPVPHADSMTAVHAANRELASTPAEDRPQRTQP